MIFLRATTLSILKQYYPAVRLEETVRKFFGLDVQYLSTDDRYRALSAKFMLVELLISLGINRRELEKDSARYLRKMVSPGI